MYHKEKSIQIKNSASALYNNLNVLRIAPRRLTYFTVVHANVVNMVSASWDGLNYSHRQLQSKEPNVATSTSLIMQVRPQCSFSCFLLSLFSDTMKLKWNKDSEDNANCFECERLYIQVRWTELSSTAVNLANFFLHRMYKCGYSCTVQCFSLDESILKLFNV